MNCTSTTLVVLVLVCLSARLCEGFSRASLKIGEKIRDPAVSLAVVRRKVEDESLVVESVESLDGHQDAVAWGEFEDGLFENGWGVLQIETNGNEEDWEQSYAAGLLEGFLTAKHILSTSKNLVEAIFHEKIMPADVQEFMNQQDQYARSKASGDDKNPFYRQLHYLMKQYDGLVDGFHASEQVNEALPIWAFQMLNGVGDLFDIIPTVQKHKRKDFTTMNVSELELFHARNGHCSAIIKVTGDFDDLFMAHSSWWEYQNTNRIFKHYKLNFNDQSTKAMGISFSSYPGFLESLDDFYLLDSGLGWTQTSNPILDHSIYDLVTPKSILAWQRVRIASALAGNGQEWAKWFKMEASGTYANQYMIVNFNLFQPGKPLPDNLLWVVEEVPGLVIGRDQTDKLRLGYWPSYNVPFYRDIFNKSGYDALPDSDDLFSYSLAPRGKIFRRDQGKVHDLKTLKRLMRSNNFLTDPYSWKNPLRAICSRGDLLPPSGKRGAFGCYDTKVTSYNYGAMERKAQILNGPTTNKHAAVGLRLPRFDWSRKAFANLTHDNLPPSYDFDFIPTKPKRLKPQ